jgi:ABC-type oligopeptide transport system ATPase subunit
MLEKGEFLGLVGESGCGKSTLARCILRLVRPDAGSILWHGQDIASYRESEMRPLRPKMQMVFQNPYGSFNPRMTMGQTLTKAGRLYGFSRTEQEAILRELLTQCELPEDFLTRRPSELSGGQLQRFALVRALLPSPELLIADEAVSALDVAVQEPILELFRRVQERYGMAVLFISHDLAVVRNLCQRTLVMYQGRIVEEGPTERIFTEPNHPYTKALLDARVWIEHTKKNQA